MELVKEKGDIKIFKKRSERHAVKQASKWLKGEDKVKVLLEEGLIKLSEKKAEEEAPAEEEEATESEAAE